MVELYWERRRRDSFRDANKRYCESCGNRIYGWENQTYNKICAMCNRKLKEDEKNK